MCDGVVTHRPHQIYEGTGSTSSSSSSPPPSPSPRTSHPPRARRPPYKTGHTLTSSLHVHYNGFRSCFPRPVPRFRRGCQRGDPLRYFPELVRSPAAGLLSRNLIRFALQLWLRLCKCFISKGCFPTDFHQPVLIGNGALLANGTDYTSNGPINSAISYVSLFLRFVILPDVIAGISRPVGICNNAAHCSTLTIDSAGDCLYNGEQCTLIELNIDNPTCPGCGPVGDISLISP